MRDKIHEIIKEAVSELNEQLEDGRKLEFSDDIKLIGRQSAIDSMDFVTLVTIIEELVADKLGKHIRVVSDKAFSMERSPFQSIGTLTDFVAELVK
ncbi:MAG: hypothetical protein IJU98_01600 [Synergistaceae bacterium]|nr:hypothetical protein [Synergistaceae bacterium]